MQKTNRLEEIVFGFVQIKQGGSELAETYLCGDAGRGPEEVQTVGAAGGG